MDFHSRSTILSHSFIDNSRYWMTEETAQHIQSLLRQNTIHAHDEARLLLEGISDPVYPVLALAHWISLKDITRRIEVSPFWFLYSVDDSFTALTAICLGCGTEFHIRVNQLQINRCCPNCFFSQSTIKDANPTSKEMEEYLFYGIQSLKEILDMQRRFRKVIRICRDSNFTNETLSLLPRDRFEGTLKQVDINKAPPEFRQIFKESFGQFSQKSYPAHLDETPGFDRIEHIIIGSRVLRKSTGRYRRFSGGPDLGAGRYYSICQDESGNDNRTLTAELLSYSTPEVGTYPALYDTLNLKLPVELVEMFSNGSLASVGSPFDPTKPALILLNVDRPLTGDFVRDAQAAKSVTACNLTVMNVIIDGVLDLRKISSQILFAMAITALQRYAPLKKDVQEKLNIISEGQVPNFGIMENFGPEEFLALLPIMTAPLKGGGTFHDAVGAFLRICGYQGLIYPSARRDCSLIYGIEGQTMIDGWSFVDYRNTNTMLSEEIFSSMAMREGGLIMTQRRVYGVYHDGRYQFASGFHIVGAEERDSMDSQKRGPELKANPVSLKAHRVFLFVLGLVAIVLISVIIYGIYWLVRYLYS